MDQFGRVSLCSVSVCQCLCISVAVETVQVVNSVSWLARDCGSLWKFQELEAEFWGWDVPRVVRRGRWVHACAVV